MFETAVLLSVLVAPTVTVPFVSVYPVELFPVNLNIELAAGVIFPSVSVGASTLFANVVVRSLSSLYFAITILVADVISLKLVAAVFAHEFHL